MVSPVPTSTLELSPSPGTVTLSKLETSESSWPWAPKEPLYPSHTTKLHLGCRTTTPFENDTIECYYRDPADDLWPTYARSKAHRLHDISALCQACDSFDMRALGESSREIQYSLRDVLNGAGDCRLCALIVQTYRAAQGYVTRRPGQFPAELNRLVEFDTVIGIALHGDLLTFHARVPGLDDVRSRMFGQLKIVDVGRPDANARDGPEAGDPDVVMASRLRTELERVLVTQAPCQICAPSSVPLPQNQTLPGSLGTIPYLPDRVIEILSTLGTPIDQIKLRLRTTDGRETARYTALSHRWGGRITLNTTKDTLNQRVQGLNVGDLPRTFRDAVWVSQALGVRYLWIDSLCIIQDDVGDWLRQSAKMGSIYMNATFAIAAHSAAQCNEGFLWRCQVPSTLRISPSSGPQPFSIVIPEIQGTVLSLDHRLSQISQRAWVMQELALSPQILHFYENHLFWECQHSNGFPVEPNMRGPATGSFELTDTFGALFRRARTALGVYDAWLDLVDVYSFLSLTNEGDKLVALAGIVTELQRELVAKGDGAEHSYHCGVFEADLDRSLLWYSLGTLSPPEAAERHLQRAPSWSWASAPRDVLFAPSRGNLEDASTATVPLLRLVGRRHEDYTDPMIQNPSCRILLEASIIRIRAEVSRAFEFKDLHPTHSALTLAYDHVSISRSFANRQTIGLCWPDDMQALPNFSWKVHHEDGSEEVGSAALTLLLVRGEELDGCTGSWCLMLRQAGGDAEVYQRIGLAYLQDFELIRQALAQPEAVTLV